MKTENNEEKQGKGPLSAPHCSDLHQLDRDGQNILLDGEQWYTFSVEYHFEGGEWGGPEFMARDWDEARRRFSAIQANGKISQVYATIKGPSAGIRVRIYTLLLQFGINPHKAWGVLCFVLIILLFLK